MDEYMGTITRRMDAVLGGLEDEFKSLYSIGDFEAQLKALKKAGTNSDRPSKLSRLFDMFDSCGIAYERGRDNAYYEELIENAGLPNFSEIEDRMLYALYTKFREYPSPEEYMTRMVNRFCTDSDGWEKDTLRMRILKQFIKYGNYLKDAGFGSEKVICDYVKGKIGRKPSAEEVLSALDDGVFNGLDAASKQQKKPEGKFGLLKAVDDLADGKFRAEGATKRNLYLFAMVYGMTYYADRKAGKNAEIPDFKTDIETNLFRDYYANNLMRFLSDIYRKKLCEYEIDPSGQGINYKNFAEMIYLYYISQDCSPQDKIKGSAEMIKRIQDKQFKKGKPDLQREEGNTVFYRSLLQNDSVGGLFSEDILNLPVEEFEEFLCSYYDCDTFTGTYETQKGTMDGKIGVFQLGTEQNSAFREYKAILQDLRELLKKTGLSMENCNYGLWFTDVASFRKKGYENICDRRPDIDRDEFDKFMELLLGLNNFMGYTVSEEVSGRGSEQEWTELSKRKTKALFVPSANAVTRTSLIVAWYYYYNLLHENDGKDKWNHFEELFNHFKKGIDVRLEAANYQPLSGKNILDVLVAFSSYAYLNL